MERGGLETSSPFAEMALTTSKNCFKTLGTCLTISQELGLLRPLQLQIWIAEAFKRQVPYLEWPWQPQAIASRLLGTCLQYLNNEAEFENSAFEFGFVKVENL